jgi:hypothetical protein|tara:strand:+ start:3147 stop:4031 length:885 start_codon:yes stop_codon:yes gene_type:complete
MNNGVTKAPKYLPHMQHKDVISMGMEPLDSHRWIEPDADYPQFLEHKLSLKELQQEHIFEALPSAYEAQVELAFELKQHLLNQHSHLYCPLADGLSYLPNGIELAGASTHPLWQASLWVADDLLIMQKLDGHYCLTAASLCSPSHWHLAQKIGQSMAKIHDPVPTLHQKLTPKIDRFFDHLMVEKPIQRFNWSLQANTNLAQFPEDKRIYPANTPLYYRCERQTLTRLPQTNAIAFTIRVYVSPMMSLTQVPNALTQLKLSIDAMPKAVAGYKEIIYFAPALQKYFSDLSSLKG